MNETRRDLEASVAATASSADGRRFTFQCSLHGLELQTGGYVAIGDARLGQVHAVDHAWVEGAELAAALHGEAPAPANVRITVARGHGIVLDAAAEPFHEEEIERAEAGTVAAWLERVRPPRASLDVGELLLEPEVRFALDAGGFDRHTFFCGQSGSGKTYALGTVLERLLLGTAIRIVVPRSELRLRPAGGRPQRCRCNACGRLSAESYGHRRAPVRRRRGRATPRALCRLQRPRAGRCAWLEPIRDRDEFGALLDVVEDGPRDPRGGAGAVMQSLLGSSSSHLQALGARIRNLGIHHWAIWSQGESGSLQDLVAPGGPRALVVDLGSLDTPHEMALAAESVLAALWRRRAERKPILVVIDEAHNICPEKPGDEVTELATGHAVRFAAEGRKFGLYLLVSTQRPQRVHELVVSQCDNLVLMRMNSAGDLAYVADLLSFAPAALLERSLSFGLGESLVSGKIASHPALVRFGPRIAEEGGEDVPTTWARP